MKLAAKWAACGILSVALAVGGSASAQTPAPNGSPYADAGAMPPAQPYVGGWYQAPACGPMDQACVSGKQEPPPLTLANFFTAGWNEEFTRRDSEGRAPDLALLRVQTNFMEREVRVNYFFENNIHNAKQSNIDSLDAFIAYAFNRRFMLEVLGNYQWIDPRGKNPDNSGPAVRLVGRVQLISTEESSYSFNFQAITPDPGLGVHQTTLSYGAAGFEDLTNRLGLYRVGLYYSFLFDSLAGPRAKGAKQNDVQYDVTIAKTLTRPDMPLIGNFTVFAETFAQTDLNGTHSGTTLVTETPGVRFNLGKINCARFGIDNWLMGGVDIPLTGPRPYDAIYRFTYITNF
jgi:hypothetical protein